MSVRGRLGIGLIAAGLSVGIGTAAWPCDCLQHPGHGGSGIAGLAAAMPAMTAAELAAMPQMTAAELAAMHGVAAPPAPSTVPAADAGPAERSATLSTSAATKKLSKKCQRLLKKKASRLGKKDRKRRSACVTKRRALIEASKMPPPTAGAVTPITVLTPPTSVPSPATPAPAPTTPDQPVPSTPAGPVTKALTVEAWDDGGLSKFRVVNPGTRFAHVIGFGLANSDSQAHNMWIVATDSNKQPVGEWTELFGSVPQRTTQYRDVKLAPGTYRLMCTVPGHQMMLADITIAAP